MRVVQLGCGITGLVCAELLSSSRLVSSLILADVRTDAAQAFKARIGSKKLLVRRVDGTNPKELRSLLRGCDLVVNSMPWGTGERVLRTAAAAGANYVDFSIVSPSRREFGRLSRACREAGVTAVTATGEDPGISDVLAVHAAGKLDSASEVHIMDGDTGAVEGQGFFWSVWSPVDLLWETTAPAAVYRNGRIEYVPPLHEKEIYGFPPPLGPLPVYKTIHEETFLVPRFVKGLRRADFRISLDDGFVDAVRMIRKLGMHRADLVDVKGAKVRPLDVIAALMPRPVDLAGEVKGHTCLVVEVVGRKGGKKAKVKAWTMASHEDAYRRFRSNAAGYLVGLGGAVTAEMVLEGDVEKKGLLVPEQLPPERFIERLSKRGQMIREEITEL